MFEEPQEDPAERTSDPATLAKEKSDEFRMHAELFAVFEGLRKFDASLRPDLSMDAAKEIQRTIGRLEKSKLPDIPVLPPPSLTDAAALLDFPAAHQLSSNDYHVHRRPGEVMIARWLAGDQVESFYTRLQAHFDAAMNAFREEERQAKAWKQDPKTSAYLDALDAIDVKMAERYLREPIKTHEFFVLSTQSADEINIAYLCDYIMGIPAPELVGAASAPPEEPSEGDLAWFFKLFSLRGMKVQEERMCFFTYLQKSNEDF